MVEYETHRGKSIDDLLAEIDAAWQRLMATMTAHPEADYATKRDQVGWTPLDHLAHVTAWERSALYPLRRKPRHEALGVTDEQFRIDQATQDFDPLNQIIREQTVGDSYDTAMGNARAVHAELVGAVRASDLDTLWTSGRELASDANEQGRDVPFIEILMSDGCEHFDEHREYIETILAS
jgi:predicted RNase H-like HicB family nuclease